MEAVIAHEAKHCENWIDSTEQLRNILERFCSDNQNIYRAISCCPYEYGDEVCKKYAEDELKSEIYLKINDAFIDKIINKPETSSPEGQSDTAEKTKFRQCSDGKHCKNK